MAPSRSFFPSRFDNPQRSLLIANWLEQRRFQNLSVRARCQSVKISPASVNVCVVLVLVQRLADITYRQIIANKTKR